MTSEEQFAAINQPDYFNKLKAKVNGIRQAMSDLGATAPEITTTVDDVMVVVSFNQGGNEGRLRVGMNETEDANLYDWTFPIRWLDGPDPAPVQSKRK